MKRAEKNAQIEEIATTFAGSASVYLVNLSGLSVPQVTDLRRRIKGARGRCKVVKNRLAIRGAKGTGAEKLAPFFKGPIGIVTHPEEPITLAKVLNDFAKDHPAFALKAGVVDLQVVEPDTIKKLANMPALPELRAMLLGLISAPASRLVRVIAASGQQVARVIDERRKKLGGE